MHTKTSRKFYLVSGDFLLPGGNAPRIHRLGSTAILYVNIGVNLYCFVLLPKKHIKIKKKRKKEDNPSIETRALILLIHYNVRTFCKRDTEYNLNDEVNGGGKKENEPLVSALLQLLPEMLY